MIKTYYLDTEPIPTQSIDHTWISTHLHIKGDALVAQKVLHPDQNAPRLRFILNHLALTNGEALLRYWRFIHLMATTLDISFIATNFTLVWKEKPISQSSISLTTESALFILDLQLCIQDQTLLFPDQQIIGPLYEFVTIIMHDYQLDNDLIQQLLTTYTHD